MPDAEATLSLIGVDKGLSRVLDAAGKGIDKISDSVTDASDGVEDWTRSLNASGKALALAGKAASSSSRDIFKFGKEAGDAYDKVTDGAQGVIDTSDVLGKTTTRLAAHFLGLGKPLGSLSTVLDPMAGFFSDVADQQNAAGKAAVILDRAEKPVVSTLKIAADIAEGFANQLQTMGAAGEWAAERMEVVAKSLRGIQRAVGIADTAGDLYLMGDAAFKFAKDAGPAAIATASTLTETFQKTGMMEKLFGDTTKTVTTLAKAHQFFVNTFKVGQGTVLDATSKSIIKFIEMGEKVTLLKTIGTALVASYIQMQNLNQAFGAFEAMGIDTSYGKLAMQLGLVGEGLLLNKEAAEEFSKTAISSFAKLEDQLAYVRTLGSASENSITSLGSAMQNLVNGPLKNTITSTQAASALYNTMSAGIGSVTQSTQVMEAGLKLASSSGADTATTMEALIKSMSAYGISAREAGNVSAKMNSIVENGIVSFPQLAGGYARVASVAKGAGVSMDELNGSIAALTYTMTADDSMTGFASLLSSIAGQGAQSEKAIAELGIKFDINTVKTKGLVASLQELYKATGGSQEKIKEIIPDSLAFTTAWNLMTNASQKAAQYTKASADATTESLDEMFNRRRESTMQRGVALMNGFQEVIVEFGQKLIPLLEPGISFLEGVLKTLQNLPEPVKALVGSLVVAKIGMDNMLGVGGNLMGMFVKLAATMAIARTASTLFSGNIGKEIDILKEMINTRKDYVGAILRVIGVEDILEKAKARSEAREAARAAAEQARDAARQMRSKGRIIEVAVEDAVTGKVLANTAAVEANTVAQATNNKGLLGSIQTTFAKAAADTQAALAADFAATKTGILGKTFGAVGVAGNIFKSVLGGIGTALKAVWVTMGPLIVVGAALTAAFLVLQDFIPALGGAAKKSQDLAEGLRKAAMGADEYNEKMKAAGKETKNYSGFLNTTVFPALEGVTKLTARGGASIAGMFTMGIVNSKKMDDAISNAFNGIKDTFQSFQDQSFFDAMADVDKSLQGPISKAKSFKSELKQGLFVSQEAKDIAEKAGKANRTLTGDELKQAMEADQKAIAETNKEIDKRAAGLQAEMDAAEKPEQKAALKARIDGLKQEATELDNVAKQQQQYINNLNAIIDATLTNQASTGQDKSLKFITDKQLEAEKDLPEWGKKTAESMFSTLTGAIETAGNSPSQRKAINSIAGMTKLAFNSLSQLGKPGSGVNINTVRDNVTDVMNAIDDAVQKGLPTDIAQELRNQFANQTVEIIDPNTKKKIQAQLKDLMSPEQLKGLQQSTTKDFQTLADRQLQIQQTNLQKIGTLQAEHNISEQEAQKQSAEIEIQNAQTVLDLEKKKLTQMDVGSEEYIRQQQVIAQAELTVRQKVAAQKEIDFEQDMQRQERLAEIAMKVATQPLQAQLNQLDQISKALQLQENLERSREGLASAIAGYQETRLNNQLRLTQDVEERAKIETEISRQRLVGLDRSQASEKRLLEMQIEQNKIAAEREVIQNRIALIENKRAIAQTKLELSRAERKKATSEELDLISLQLESLEQQGDALESMGGLLEKNKEQQVEIAENSRKELQYKQAAAKETAQIDYQLAKAKELVAVYEKQKQRADLAAKALELQGQIQQARADAIGKAYEYQNQLLSAQKDLMSAQASTMETYFNLAIGATKSERERRQLTEVMNKVKLVALVQQQKIERQIFEIQQLQNKAALEREKIQNRIQQAQSDAEIAGAKAELEKTKATPGATPEQLKASQLALDAALEKGAGLKFTEKLLDIQGQNQEVIAGYQRQAMDMKQGTELFQAQYAAANKYERRQMMGDLKQQLQPIVNEYRDMRVDPARTVNLPGGIMMAGQMPTAAQMGQSYDQIRSSYMAQKEAELMGDPSYKKTFDGRMQGIKSEKEELENTTEAQKKYIDTLKTIKGVLSGGKTEGDKQANTTAQTSSAPPERRQPAAPSVNSGDAANEESALALEYKKKHGLKHLSGQNQMIYELPVWDFKKMAAMGFKDYTWEKANKMGIAQRQLKDLDRYTAERNANLDPRFKTMSKKEQEAAIQKNLNAIITGRDQEEAARLGISVQESKPSLRADQKRVDGAKPQQQQPEDSTFPGKQLNLTQPITFQNYFNGEDVQNGKVKSTVEQQLFDALKSVYDETERKLKA